MVQHEAKQRKENLLDMRDLQARANPSNADWLTRNEMRSAVRVRSSALSERRRGLHRLDLRSRLPGTNLTPRCVFIRAIRCQGTCLVGE
jgi:hypothetical protein